MIYAIIPLQEVAGLEEHVIRIDARACLEEAPLVYFLSYQGTSSELFNELHLGKMPEESLLILRVHEYYGVASSQLWEWLASRKNGHS